MSAHKSPHQAPTRSDARHPWGLEIAGRVLPLFQGKGWERVVGHTNEAA